MTNKHRMSILAWIMTAIGAVGAVITILLRVWMSPSRRDIDTGLFATNTPVILLMLVLLLALGAVAFLLRDGKRQEFVEKPALLLSVVLLAAGGAMALFGGAELLSRAGVIRFYTVTDAALSPLNSVLMWAQSAFCLLGGVALVRLGLMLASEGSSRRGMVQWGLLAPVLWMWLVLVNYEMSYASMVRISEGFFTLAMYIMELLFLFCFARYIAGVGKLPVGVLLFCSCGTALFALSAPLVKLIMYLLHDVEAYTAAGAAGPIDLVVGVLALAVSITLSQSLSCLPPEVVEPKEEEEDVSAEVELFEFAEEDASEE